LITYYALAKLQAIFVPLDPSFKEDELTYYLSDSDPCAVITDLKRADRCRAVLAQLDRRIPLIVIDGTYPSSISFHELIQEPTESEDIPAPYEGDMVYHYSSGSTGRPKRVCRTQKNLFYDGDNTANMIGVTAADTILCTIPMFHSWG